MRSAVEQRNPGGLRPHPLNAAIYDAERDDSDLRRSIDERGMISPLVIDQHGTILAGHRRWRAAGALALDTVPVIVRAIDNPLEAERVLIESNRQREKTMSERMHEADNIERIIAEENRRKMIAGVTADGGGGRGHKLNPVLNSTQGLGDGKTRTQVAEAVGLKPDKYRKIKHVHDTANDESVPEPIRAVAQQQMAALDAGDATAHAAAQAVREAKRRAQAETEQATSDGIMAHINRDGALERAALRTAYFTARATTHHKLLDLDPATVADTLKDTDLDGARDFAAALVAWGSAFGEALPRGLRLLKAK